ncbi:carboxypeptidase-like regulatory domain-containing protein, partial [candidate division KSB1 bacterium]|nr:carboxypeptidase-like regulatory domain-containing protein [candidate division KSB1 bacterium]
MKLSVLVLSIITVISEIILAQDNTTLHLSVNYKNIPLEEIIEEIDNKHNIKFSYLDQFVENKRITAFFKNKPLPEALQNILQGTSLSFQIVDSTNVIIFKKTVEESFSIQGQIIEKESGLGVPFANVIIASLGAGDAAGSSGFFEISELMPDKYSIEFRALGYKQLSKKIDLKEDLILNAELEIQPIKFAPVEITPGIIEISSEETSTHVLSSEEILSSPNFFKDVYRSIQILPGISNTDLSAKPRIKGGH